MDTVTVRTNLPEFRAQMIDLGIRVRGVVSSAARAGAVVYRDEARRVVRHDTGLLRRAITVRKSKRPNRGAVEYIVGVRMTRKEERSGRRTSMRGKVAEPYYWRFLEAGWIPRSPGQRLRGTAARKTTQRNELRKTTALKIFPFLGPAFKAASSRALAAFYAALDQGVAKEASKR